jgi:hypothetical protein
VPNAKEIVSERLNRAVALKIIKLAEQYNQETDPKRKIDLKYKLGRTLMGAFVSAVMNLSDADFKIFLKEQFGAVFKAIENIGTEYVNKKMSRGELTLQDIQLMAYESETVDRISKYDLLGMGKSKLPKKKQFERIVALSLLSMFSNIANQAYLNSALEPLEQLNNLVMRRFGADGNWVFTVATLATHENLVKKKLIDLGMSEKGIEDVSRQGGLNPLVSRLVKLIESKENRQVSLGFYQASGLRAVRNEIEHHGYARKVTHDEMRNVLKDVLRFEAELFHEPSSQRPSGAPPSH